MLPNPGQPTAAEPFWRIVVDFLPFVLRLFTDPRQLVRSLNWDAPAELSRVALYTLIGLAILVLAFSNNQRLADEVRPPLSGFKGVVMRAHDTSWDWLEPVYAPFHLEPGEAKRLWDTLLTGGFMLYTLLASLIGVAVVARLRMWRFGLGYCHALGTGLLAWLAGTSCIALSLVPLFELLICRECFVRLSLFVLLNLAGWTYAGYYTLADLGERPRRAWLHLLKSLGYGLAQYALAYVVFFALIVAIIPM
ncbi:hypothetical protein JW859_03020 [bacterium]|nr:hypothetical protein [bacterium]